MILNISVSQRFRFAFFMYSVNMIAIGYRIEIGNLHKGAQLIPKGHITALGRVITLDLRRCIRSYRDLGENILKVLHQSFCILRFQIILRTGHTGSESNFRICKIAPGGHAGSQIITGNRMHELIFLFARIGRICSAENTNGINRGPGGLHTICRFNRSLGNTVIKRTV